MTTRQRKSEAADLGGKSMEFIKQEAESTPITTDLCTPDRMDRDQAHLVTHPPSSPEERVSDTVTTGVRHDSKPPKSGLKRKGNHEHWSKERLTFEYKKLMKLRVLASMATAEATEARRRAVAASGSVVEQERNILAHVANRAERAFQKKQQALEICVAKYNRSRESSKDALEQVDAMKTAAKSWNEKNNRSSHDQRLEFDLKDNPHPHCAKAPP